MTQDLPTLGQAKALAKRVRDDLAAEGVHISHSQALEKIAHRNGFRDWNALHAAIKDAPPKRWRAGQRVSGYYLSQRFTGMVLSADEVEPGWFRLVLDFDEAVDVVRFQGFSSFRKRVRTRVGPDGWSNERTSDGRPHVELDR